MRWPRATAIHAGFLAVAAAAGTTYWLAGPDGRTAVYTAATAIPVITFLIVLSTGRMPDRRPWLVATLGLVVLLGVQLRWPDWITGHFGRAEGSSADVAMWVAHGLFLVGVSLVLRRRASADRGGILDAALFGVCATGPLWAWVVKPQLPPGASTAGQIMLLADLLVLGAVVAGLVRIGMVARPGRGSIGYFVLTTALTLVATVLAAVSPGGVWPVLTMMTAFLTLAAGPLHPEAPALTRPVPAADDVVTRPRLGWLGVALSVNPVIAAVQTARSEGSGDLLLPIGTLLVIPLVVLRVQQLTSQRDRAEQTLAYHATHDELTGLVNRRHVTATLDRLLAAGDGVTVLLCDLDRFKPINDAFGHPAGDEVLKAVSARLTAVVRDGDVVGRLGGDEFVVLCPALPSSAALRERIVAAVAEPIAVPGGVVSVGVTIGAARREPGEQVGREALIQRADQAMYAGKPSRAALEQADQAGAPPKPTSLPSGSR